MVFSYLFTVVVTNYGICHTHAMDVAQQSMQPFLIELICIDDSCKWHEEINTIIYITLMGHNKTR